MKFITAIDPDDSKPDILKASTIAYMTEKDKRKYPIGWMRTTEHDDWSRTGTLAGSSAMLKRQSNGYTWVFVTNTQFLVRFALPAQDRRHDPHRARQGKRLARTRPVPRCGRCLEQPGPASRSRCSPA
ncbi:MAG: hypothetical protein ACLR8Y_01235 [Alistipes indistinctus]